MWFDKANKYKTYYYDLFQKDLNDKPDLMGLINFFKEIVTDDVEIYFIVYHLFNMILIIN